MKKLDKYFRLRIPKKLIKDSSTDFTDIVRIYRSPKIVNVFYLDNPRNQKTCMYECGEAVIDKRGRIFFDRILQNRLDIYPNATYFSICLLDGKITFKTKLKMKGTTHG